jgi:hypothetical protein
LAAVAEAPFQKMEMKEKEKIRFCAACNASMSKSSCRAITILTPAFSQILLVAARLRRPKFTNFCRIKKVLPSCNDRKQTFLRCNDLTLFGENTISIDILVA